MVAEAAAAAAAAASAGCLELEMLWGRVDRCRRAEEGEGKVGVPRRGPMERVPSLDLRVGCVWRGDPHHLRDVGLATGGDRDCAILDSIM